MSLLDLPLEALSWADAAIDAPPVMRVIAWGVVAGAISMGVYRLLSPQARLVRMSDEAHRLQATLRREDTAMREGVSAARRLLSLALARIGLASGPTVAGAIPVLCLMVWLQIHHAYDLPPPDEVPVVRVRPEGAHVRWVADRAAPPRVEVTDGIDQILQSVSLVVPMPVVHKRLWWSGLIGNPLGYLDDDSPAERIEIGLPPKRYLEVGPDWVRGWEAPFLASLLAVSLGLKLAFRIR